MTALGGRLVLFGSAHPGWSPAQCCDEWEMQGFKPGILEKLFVHNATRIMNLARAVAIPDAVWAAL